MNSAANTPTNQHGRKFGRGLRPYFLLPKIVGIALLVGGMASVCVLLLDLPREAPLLHEQLERIAHLYQCVIIPGASVATAAGVALLWMHGKALWALRWMKAKVILAALTIPLLHVLSHHWLEQAEEYAEEAQAALALGAAHKLLLLTLGGLVAMLLLIWLGRHKPRLGEKFGARKTA